MEPKDPRLLFSGGGTGTGTGGGGGGRGGGPGGSPPLPRGGGGGGGGRGGGGGGFFSFSFSFQEVFFFLVKLGLKSPGDNKGELLRDLGSYPGDPSLNRSFKAFLATEGAFYSFLKKEIGKKSKS